MKQILFHGGAREPTHHHDTATTERRLATRAERRAVVAAGTIANDTPVCAGAAGDAHERGR
jgi:hypothetical protein